MDSITERYPNKQNEKKPIFTLRGKTRWKGLGKIALGAGALAVIGLGTIHVYDENRHVSYDNPIIQQIDYTARDAKKTAGEAKDIAHEAKDVAYEAKDTADKAIETVTPKKPVVKPVVPIKPVEPKKPVEKLDEKVKEEIKKDVLSEIKDTFYIQVSDKAGLLDHKGDFDKTYGPCIAFVDNNGNVETHTEVIKGVEHKIPNYEKSFVNEKGRKVYQIKVDVKPGEKKRFFGYTHGLIGKICQVDFYNSTGAKMTDNPYNLHKNTQGRNVVCGSVYQKHSGTLGIDVLDSNNKPHTCKKILGDGWEIFD